MATPTELDTKRWEAAKRSLMDEAIKYSKKTGVDLNAVVNDPQEQERFLAVLRSERGDKEDIPALGKEVFREDSTGRPVRWVDVFTALSGEAPAAQVRFLQPPTATGQIPATTQASPASPSTQPLFGLGSNPFTQALLNRVTTLPTSADVPAAAGSPVVPTVPAPTQPAPTQPFLDQGTIDRRNFFLLGGGNQQYISPEQRAAGVTQLTPEQRLIQMEEQRKARQILAQRESASAMAEVRAQQAVDAADQQRFLQQAQSGALFQTPYGTVSNTPGVMGPATITEGRHIPVTSLLADVLAADKKRQADAGMPAFLNQAPAVFPSRR